MLRSCAFCGAFVSLFGVWPGYDSSVARTIRPVWAERICNPALKAIESRRGDTKSVSKSRAALEEIEARLSLTINYQPRDFDRTDLGLLRAVRELWVAFFIVKLQKFIIARMFWSGAAPGSCAPRLELGSKTHRLRTRCP